MRLYVVMIHLCILFLIIAGSAVQVCGSDIRNMSGTWSVNQSSISGPDGLMNGTEYGVYDISHQGGRFFSATLTDPRGSENTSIVGCIGPDNRSVIMISDQTMGIGSFLGAEEVSIATISPNDVTVTMQELVRDPVLPGFTYPIEDITGWWPVLNHESVGQNSEYRNVTPEGAGLLVRNQTGRVFFGDIVAYGDENLVSAPFYGALMGDGLTVIGITNTPSLVMGRFMEDKTGILHEVTLDNRDPVITTIRISQTGQYSGPGRAIPDLTGVWTFSEPESGSLAEKTKGSEHTLKSMYLLSQDGSILSGELYYGADGNCVPVWGTVSDDGSSVLMKGEQGELFLGYRTGEELTFTMIDLENSSLYLFSAQRG